MFSADRLKTILASLTTAENVETIESLISDLTERNDFLSQAGTIVDDGDNATFTPTAIEASDDYKGKFEALQKKYIERFMNGVEKDTQIEDNIEEIESEQKDDIEEDTSTINELFKEGE